MRKTLWSQDEPPTQGKPQRLLGEPTRLESKINLHRSKMSLDGPRVSVKGSRLSLQGSRRSPQLHDWASMAPGWAYSTLALVSKKNVIILAMLHWCICTESYRTPVIATWTYMYLLNKILNNIHLQTCACWLSLEYSSEKSAVLLCHQRVSLPWWKNAVICL